MSHPFNTFALKMKVHCRDCEKKLKNELQNIKGVRSVEIDQKLEKVIISGKVDPAKILTKLEKVGREAELWCEQEHRRKDITRLKVIDPLNDPDIMTQLEQFTDPSDEIVEVKTTIKMIFKGESRNGVPSNKIVEITTTTKNVKKHQDQVLTHDHDCSHSGGGLCAASSSCCGGHAAISHNLDYGCCQYGNNTNLGPCCAHGRNSSYYHSKYGNDCAHYRNSCYNCHCQYVNTSYDSCYANSNSGPIWSNDNIPSAPPMPDDYNYKASPSPSSSARPQPYYRDLSDENENSCTIL